MSDATSNISNDAMLAWTIQWEQQSAVVARERVKLGNITKQGDRDGLPTKELIEASKKRKKHGESIGQHLRNLTRAVAVRLPSLVNQIGRAHV